jgi:hypothetical protein
MAELQHMCLCECDDPPQIKAICVFLLYHKTEFSIDSTTLCVSAPTDLQTLLK